MKKSLCGVIAALFALVAFAYAAEGRDSGIILFDGACRPLCKSYDAIIA